MAAVFPFINKQENRSMLEPMHEVHEEEVGHLHVQACTIGIVEIMHKVLFLWNAPLFA